MSLNPYQPTGPSDEHRSFWHRVANVLVSPMPVRRTPPREMQWVLDAFVAFGLWLFGIITAGVIDGSLWFLGSLSESTALMIAWYPIVIWIFYCGIAPGSWSSWAPIVVVLLVVEAIQDGARGFVLMPVSAGILAVALPLESLVWKLILAAFAKPEHRAP